MSISVVVYLLGIGGLLIVFFVLFSLVSPYIRDLPKKEKSILIKDTIKETIKGLLFSILIIFISIIELLMFIFGIVLLKIGIECYEFKKLVLGIFLLGVSILIFAIMNRKHYFDNLNL